MYVNNSNEKYLFDLCTINKYNKFRQLFIYNLFIEWRY